MKFYIIQPWYSMNASDVDRCFEEMIGLLNGIDESADVIVMPEACDVPASVGNDNEKVRRKFAEPLRNAVIAAAKRCKATVFANSADETETGLRNTTFVIGADGKTRVGTTKPSPLRASSKRTKTAFRSATIRMRIRIASRTRLRSTA